MDEEAQDEHQHEPNHDGEESTSEPTDLENQLQPEYDNDNDNDHDNDNNPSTESATEEQTESMNDEEITSSTDSASEQQLEHENNDNSSSIQEHGMNQMEADDDGDDDELPSREVDSDLDKSESLPSFANSDHPSNQPEEINDRPYNHSTTQNGDELVKPSLSAKKERHIADALPNDFDLLADYDDDSIDSSQNATKLTWSAFKIAYLISAPAFIIGIALVIMGALNFPPTFNLLTIGIPVFIIAGLVFIGSTVYLCFYKAKKMKFFEFGGNDMEGEIAGVSNMSYAHDEETMVPNMAFDNKEETMPSDQEGEVFTNDGEIVQTKVIYTSEGQEESLPL